jgi:hypothetical protein
MVGLRGVGKTVLLDRMKDDAEERGIHTIRIEAPEGKSLPALLAPEVRSALIRLSFNDKARDLATRGLRALTGFAKSLKVTFNDIEVGFDQEAEAGLADNGDLEHDLKQLLESVGVAAKKAETALAIFIDELQYVDEDQLAALITGLHHSAQKRLPVVLVGAGLPQLRAKTGAAKSYAERLFDFPEVGPLPAADARIAISKPTAAAGVKVAEDALDEIFTHTRGYPYFVQEWGKHVWDIAARSPITVKDVRRSHPVVIAALDKSFFLVRYDRSTPQEKRYLRAMASIGPGPHRSGDIAKALGRDVTSMAPLRNQLISKGMIWSPSHGDTAFTVPLFDEFMKRIMPGDDWRED